ncbi:MAG: antibiotic transporter [Actinobacteria bacterium]|nr:antibiotic transporter [Actinomycetota bacterium]
MTVISTARPTTSTVSQWWVLTTRLIAPTLRNGELVIAFTASAVFTAGFYIPLNQVIGARTGMSSYAQYLMPMVVMQAIAFASISASFRAATDAVQGINRRFSSMPIAASTPLAARMSASMYRCVIGLTAAIISVHVVGFRFYGSIWNTIGLCALALMIGFTLSLLADVIGTASRNPEATTQWLALPQLIFGMLSVGFQPAALFPEWIQPLVRNQPVSQFIYAMRALAGDSTPTAGVVDWATIGPSVLWIAALITVTVILSKFVLGRRS